MTIAYVGLGSNLGDKLGYIKQALDMLEAVPGLSLLRVASLYETAPWGNVEQAWYVNTVAEIDSQLTPEQLLEVCLSIEKQLGRTREVRWGPRTLDLDLLLFGHEKIKLPQLQVPHPRLAERAFVLVPLAELQPDLIIPQGSVRELAARSLLNQEIKKINNGITQ